MHRTYEAIGQVPIPTDVLRTAQSLLSFSPAPKGSEVRNIFLSPLYGRKAPPGAHVLKAYLDDIEASLPRRASDPAQDVLLAFNAVSRHRDENFYIGKHLAQFLHIVIQGTAELHFPGLKDASRRVLPLVPGQVFWMNSTLYHEVRQIAPQQVLTLTRTLSLLR